MFRTTVDDLSLFGGRTAAGPKPSFRPAVEALEERMVLSFSLSSSFFGHGSTIPVEFASSGPYSGNWSPPLKWEDVPAGTLSFALIMDDVSIPSVADPNVKETFNHWVIFNIPASTLSLRGAIPRREVLDDGALQGVNGNGAIDLLEGKPVSARGLGYLGPGPTDGKTHTYVFRLFALSTAQLTQGPGSQTPLTAGATKEQLEIAMGGTMAGQGSILAVAELRGLFNKAHYQVSNFVP